MIAQAIPTPPIAPLKVLLIAIFPNSIDLRLFVVEHYWGHQHQVSNNLSHSQYVLSVIVELASKRCINDAFFNLLIESAPGRVADISEVATAWRAYNEKISQTPQRASHLCGSGWWTQAWKRTAPMVGSLLAGFVLSGGAAKTSSYQPRFSTPEPSQTKEEPTELQTTEDLESGPNKNGPLNETNPPPQRESFEDGVPPNTNPQGSDFRGADLRGIDFRGVDLRGVDLSGADLRGVDLSEADLRGVDLSEADLRGADLSGAKSSEATFDDVVYDSTTQWPEDFRPESVNTVFYRSPTPKPPLTPPPDTPSFFFDSPTALEGEDTSADRPAPLHGFDSTLEDEGARDGTDEGNGGGTYVGNPGPVVHPIFIVGTIDGITWQNPQVPYSTTSPDCQPTLTIPDRYGGEPLVEELDGEPATSCIAFFPVWAPIVLDGRVGDTDALVQLDLDLPSLIFKLDDLPRSTTLILELGGENWSTVEVLSPNGEDAYIDYNNPEHDTLVEALRVGAALYLDEDGDGKLSQDERDAGPIAYPLD